jgi:glycosyltransferase involved in cell wall biosynthesis
MKPKVSVIIPVYNGERFIRYAIQSAVDQTYPNLEIIVVDDGSIDGTQNLVLNNFPSVSYYFQKNKGAAAARNLGMEKSTGEYLAFLDSDDIWLPEKISRQMEQIAKNPEIKLIHTNIKIQADGQIRDTAYPVDHQEGRIFENLLLQTGSVVCSTLLAKKECFEKVGNFDEELRTAEDVHLFLRLAYYYDFHFLNEALVIKVHHGTNLTSLSNIYFGSGTLSSLEKIEQLFPQYSRGKSNVMRRAFFLRARLRAAAYSQKGEYTNAFHYLMKALSYHRTLRNFLSISYQMVRIYLNIILKR